MPKRIVTLLLCSIFMTEYCLCENVVVSTDNTSLVLTAERGKTPQIVHYGAKIAPSQVDGLFDAIAGISGSSSPLTTSVYPAFGSETNTLTSLEVVHADGNPTAYLTLGEMTVESVAGGEHTRLLLTDSAYAMTVCVNYLTDKSADMIETWVEISNNEKKDIVLKRVDSGFLPIRQSNAWLTSFYGAWTSEAKMVSEPLNHGVKTIKNLDGARNAQTDRAEMMITLDGRPEEDHGRTIGIALCWSGNYELRVNTDNEIYHNIMSGLARNWSEYTLKPGETFTTPRMVFTYSADGMGGVSRNFHKWARHGAVHGTDKPRDILLNSWEGVYMDISEAKMHEMMRDFAALGGELFVMDDGWFGEKYPRKTDSSSLGDWRVDREKLPSGIEGLIREAKRNGLKFGIWIEPESVNMQSELYENHPDWVMQVKNRQLIRGRGGTQLLLDLSNPAVQDFVFGVIDGLLTEYPDIAYIKWDSNASAPNYGSTYLDAGRQLQTNTAWHKGLESVLKRVRNKWPEVVMQACGGGGARVSYGVLPYFDEMWVSDNTDALQRIYIQWGTSMFYPAIAMGQHVSATPNHQTGRTLPLKFRFDVAMSGRLGLEMQPSAMSDDERRFSCNAIAEYKKIRETVQNGNLHRLVSPYDGSGFASLMYVDDKADKAVVFAYKLTHFCNQPTPRFYLKGLSPDKVYLIRELNIPEGDSPSPLDGKAISGSVLMNAGIEMPMDKEYASRVFELTTNYN